MRAARALRYVKWIAMAPIGPNNPRSLKVNRFPPAFSIQVGPAMSTFNLTPPTEAQRREITAGLDGSERRVLLEHGTEAAFCGVFLDNKKDGIYTCRFCGLPLFRSN